MLHAIRSRLSGLAASIVRFPITVGFLLATAVLTAISISSSDDLLRYILACAVGASAGAAAQSAYERFFIGLKWRVGLYAAALLLTALFCMSVRTVSESSGELALRSVVTLFTFWIAFLWLCVVRGAYSFNESFMAAFKALFQSGFFSGVLFLGCAAIIAAVDRLITPVDSKAYSHVANIVFILFSPLLFLSLIPVYPGRRAVKADNKEDADRSLIEKRTSCPKFLEVLLSYIVIPLVSIFTVILLVYIALNIGGKFWTNNLLEPMLVSYTIAVITLTLLAGKIENRFAGLFRKIFPKVLIPIALFQTIASVFLLADTGVTVARYYVILYGIFAVFSGAALSALPIRRSGAVAALLVTLSVLSLVPPTDAYTVSRVSQIGTLEVVLKENGMLADQRILPNGRISDADKAKIIACVQQLSQTDNLGRVKELPAGFNAYDDNSFYAVFGFHQYTPGQAQYTYIGVSLDPTGVIPISGEYALVKVDIPGWTGGSTLSLGNKTFKLAVEGNSGALMLVVKDDRDLPVIKFDVSQIFARYASFPPSKSTLTGAEATFIAENDAVALKIIVLTAGFTTAPGSQDQNAQLLVFMATKPPSPYTGPLGEHSGS